MSEKTAGTVTVAGTLVALLAFGYAEFMLPDRPLLSDYALVSGGLLPVVIGMLALASACLSLAYGLATGEPGRTAATRVLLLAAAGGLMLCALFPTDATVIKSASGEIHRWAGAVVFTTLPVAAWGLARGRAALPRWTAVKALSVTSAVALAVYLAAHPASFTSPWIGGEAYYGLLQRGLVLTEVVLVAAMAVAFMIRRTVMAPPVTGAAPAARDERLAA
ncbi:DUF998 domain-containing protein [Nonomuraea sp. ZG12]|uniref:DUF998 domain-containing protein n=1 Tax=Nonomuraea sp. ZG12 TaxID=3452207 RepID=UPI003F8A265F